MKKVACFLFSLLISGLWAAPLGGLYLPDDDVEILNADNFQNIVENSNSAWLVEFYANWCGYCQRFSQPWKLFATEVASWRNLVRVGVVDCSGMKNIPICRAFGISKYPTLRYFHENFQISDGNVGVVVEHGKANEATPQSLKKIVFDTLITEIEENRGKQYPNLLPYLEPTYQNIFEGVAEDVEYVFLVVEAWRSYLGAEVAMDLNQTPKIAIRYALDNNTELVEELKVEKFPSVVVFDRNNNFEILDVGNRNEIKATIVMFLEGKGFKIVEVIPDKIQNNTVDPNPDHKQKEKIILPEYIKKMGDVVFQSDLEAALRYSLQQEVGTVQVIKDEPLQALRVYLNVVKKYFPFGYNRTSLITQLIELASKSDEIEGSTVQNLVNEAEENGVFSSPQRFLGCQGTATRFRGYPCSLWRLFHYFTVNSVHYYIGHKNANGREVLDAMYGYIKNFFSCEHCSQHFQKMAAERNLTSVSSLEEAVMWLWESHNVVNARLKGDATEDPEYPKEQFPTKFRCPECYNSDNSWNRKEVRKYLDRMYNRYNVRYIGSDTKILFPGLD